MSSLSNQLATITEKLKNTTNWLRETVKDFKTDHDEQLGLQKDVDALKKRQDSFDSLKRAMIITIVGAAASAIFGVVVAIFNMMAKGGSTP